LVTADRDFEQPNQSDGAPHDAVGAYLLDALPEEERVAFAGHLATCESCRREVAQLTPVVALLPRLLELDFEEEAGAVAEALPPPSPGLRDRILEVARAEARPVVAEVAPVEPVEPVPVRPVQTLRESPFAPDEPVAFPPSRPRGRIRGGDGIGSGKEPVSPWGTMGQLNRGWLAAAVLAIVAVGGIIWALALMGRIDDKDREIAALSTRAADNTNLSAWHLVPGTGNQTGPSGIVLYSVDDKTGALVVSNMPALPADKVYQSWLIRSGHDPVPGPTFTIDDQGRGSAPVESDTPGFNVVAITQEPVGGSDAPTSPILLQGELPGAFGGLPGVGIAAVSLSPPATDPGE
jgi:anti-sigma factor RsiW